MAKLVYGLNQSLDGYIDHLRLGPPGPTAFRHFVDHVRGLAGMVYGRGSYEVMRYWDEDQPDWEKNEHDFAAAWRTQPKWVISRSLKSVGPNARLIAENVELKISSLKAELTGEISVGGPELVRSLTGTDLIDEYQFYLRPVVLESGKRFFAASPPPLRLLTSHLIGDDIVRLTYVPAWSSNLMD